VKIICSLILILYKFLVNSKGLVTSQKNEDSKEETEKYHYPLNMMALLNTAFFN
jgi:hypothetical protein